MPISSKEIAIIVVETIIAVLIGFLLDKPNFSMYSLNDSIVIIMMIIFVAAIVLVIVYKKVSEVNEELNLIKSEQKRLDEKLKIYERLSVVEQKLGI